MTEEFHPGFKNSVASYTVSLLNPKIIADMNLAGNGLRVVERKLQNFLPLNDREYLETGGGRTKESVAKFSNKDAEMLDPYGARLEEIADILRGMMLQTPPNVTEGGWFSAIPEMIKAGLQGKAFTNLSMPARRDLLALFAQSAGDYLDGWFESSPIKAVYGFDGVVGNYASPFTPGSGYVLLHHLLGEVNGKKGAWGHAIGGMGAITQAMAKACAALGVTINTDAPVKEVIVEKGPAPSVSRRKTATSIARPVVASNLNPKLLYLKLVDRSLLPRDFRERIEHYKVGSGTFRMNVALSEFTTLHLQAGRRRSHDGGHHRRAHPRLYGPRLHHGAREWLVHRADCRIADPFHARRQPRAEGPACRKYVLPAGPAGIIGRPVVDDHREEVADLMIATVDRMAPGFKASVVGRQILSPLDLERTFGLVGGDIMHGALSLDQLYSARPVLGHGNYRAPIPGLYMCGSGTHPGGGVTGAPGHNAALEIIKDRRARH
ncbi:MAG: NAD(P)/FAD-dependent oxidoreductase [Rhizomicrobium sp.]